MVLEVRPGLNNTEKRGMAQRLRYVARAIPKEAVRGADDISFLVIRSRLGHRQRQEAGCMPETPAKSSPIIANGPQCGWVVE